VGDPRGVDEDVDPLDRRQRRTHRFEVRDVAADGGSPGFRGDLRGGRLVHVENRHERALGRQPAHDGCADPRSAPRDDDLCTLEA
jgi:hypothetical protein